MIFSYNDIDYKVEIIKKNNKNIYIRVKDDLIIYVTCPLLYNKKMIEKLLSDNYDSIIRMIDNQEKKKNRKQETPNSLLGKKIDVVYCNIFKTTRLEDNKLYVKDEAMLNKWYVKQAKEIFLERLNYIYSLFEEDIPYPILKIRLMKTRWGVCNKRDNSVTLNLELIKKDIKYLDYVIVHELSHFVHFNHSALFWKEVSKYCANYKLIRKELKE